MCGIAGAVGFNQLYVSKEKVTLMTESISHRGPDDSGLWSNSESNIILGHRRLSIIDLSVAGAQPMHYLNRYTIVFNGEIYNYLELKSNLIKNGYHFLSNSDTEVLLALFDLYKEKCLQFLDGMFAFAIWDSFKNELFCARDRFGEKPFYYTLINDALLFCSEIKGLVAAGIEKKINNVMLFNYKFFDHFYNPNSQKETFYSNIQCLAPATYIIINKFGKIIEEKKYWDIDYLNINTDISIDEAILKFKELFRTSISRRLRSDVPIGSSLSGGLDSSAVVCTINSLQNKTNLIHTFSARFPGFKKDESKYIDTVNAFVNAKGYSCYPEESNYNETIKKVIHFQDEPFRSSSILVQYNVMRLAKNESVIVLLDGQGADEYLCGYHGLLDTFYNELRKKDLKEYKKQIIDFKENQNTNEVNPLRRRMIGLKIKNTFTNHQINKLIQFKTIFSNYDNLDSIKDLFYTHRNDMYERIYKTDTLNEMLYEFTMRGSLQELLRYADRNSMAHSIEVRLPFLFHELVEFVFSLPPTYKVNKGYTKYILRKSLESEAPDSIIWRKDKIGYEPPNKDSLNGVSLKESLLNEFYFK